jgi:hypothetical protein
MRIPAINAAIMAGGVALLLATTPGAAHATDDICMMANPPRAAGEDIGLLNVREKPNTKSKIRMTVGSGEILLMSNDPTFNLFKDWALMIAVVYRDPEKGMVHYKQGEASYGWVSRKHLKPAECLQKLENGPNDIGSEDMVPGG